MRTNTNALLLSPSYHGTSFAEISDALVKVIEAKRLPIDIVGRQEHFSNTLAANKLDDSRFIEAHLQNIQNLLRGRYRKVLSMDFYSLGLDMLQYQADQEERPIELGALFHGASFMDRDVYEEGWISKFEQAWGNLYSKIYSPSPDSVDNFPGELRPKVRVFPWGMDNFEKVASEEKTIEVLFPHRLSADKGIPDLIEIAKLIPDVTIHITVPQTQSELENNEYYKDLQNLANLRFIVGESDEEHHHSLARSKIVLSSAYQELFGYSVMKAVASGAIPVLPNRQCYPHYFAKENIYTTNQNAADKITTILSDLAEQERITKLTEETRTKIGAFSFEAILKDFFG